MRTKDRDQIYHLVVPVTNFKVNEDDDTFTCYGNVKNYIDHALDRSVDGCFLETIKKHGINGTMPKMFWMHNPYDLPVGPWLDWKEDEHGLWMKGRLSDTAMGRDIRVLAKDKALDSFSIGYRVIDGKWNNELNCYDLLEIDVMEVSWVNFACNEASTLQSIKSHLDETGEFSKADLRMLIKSSKLGLSSREIEKITSYYNPETKNDFSELGELLANSSLCK